MNRIYLNNNWLFTKNYTEDLLLKEADLSMMEAVRIPHTVCETPFNYFDETCYQMVSGYRRVIEIEDSWRDGHLLLTVEGAAHEATVYINGQKAGKHYSGYTAFTVDMVPYLTEGRNQVVVVRLDSNETVNQPPFGYVIDYMTYGGIYRDVYLEVKGKYYIEDVYAVTPDVLRDDKPLKADVTINEVADGMTIEAELDLWSETESDDGEGTHWEFVPETIRFKTSCLTYMVEGAMNWDLDMPFLYMLTVRLKLGQEVLDTKQVRFGFREAVFEEDGFYLNGEKVKIRGLNRHQSWPYVGYAMPKSPQQMDADILKFELGCNLVRTSHYPQSQYFIDRCDEIGLLVFTEIPGWQHIGDTRWKKIAVRNVREMIMQYRNHPSIILWGVRINESLDCDPFYYKTNQLAHELDLYRQTGGVRYLKHSHLYEDVYTYNDFSHHGYNYGCTPKENVTTDMSKGYMITEYNGHMFPTKTSDDEPHRLEHALRHANVLAGVAENEDIAGSIGWCMFDYNTHKDFGSGDRICYHGVLDMFRNAKMAAAVYKSQQDQEPVCVVSHAMNIGDHPASLMGDIYVFTNADSIRLYKGDLFIGEFYPDETMFGSMVHPPVIIDDLVGDQMSDNDGIDPDIVKAAKPLLKVMRENHGKLDKADHARLAAILKRAGLTVTEASDLYAKYHGGWGSDAGTWRFVAVKGDSIMAEVVKGPARQPAVRIMADRQTLVEGNSYDVATIQLEAVDEYGNHLDYFSEPVLLKAEGDITLIGPSMLSMQGGFAGTYVKSMGREGSGILTIESRLGSAQVSFSVVEEKH